MIAAQARGVVLAIIFLAGAWQLALDGWSMGEPPLPITFALALGALVLPIPCWIGVMIYRRQLRVGDVPIALFLMVAILAGLFLVFLLFLEIFYGEGGA